ncbi:HD domain-containing protein [Bailinhaonella thermotolerans]|uniref:HD domain-containing protein n=1 Tax=Bailinhaonella thermotolerans TaxID=1070861 RepID=A0A3A4A556_9ACTN|nr:HD domain-containing protein [Bailinhaonella thermotolerans]RJL22991.1 HD domain-containing protein [Bailinhaonella thermotolerans]
MDVYGDLPFPRTALAEAATRYAREIVPEPIFNHCMRTYLYGRALGEARGMRAGHDYDDELLFLGSVLHDTGLSEPGDGDQRFDLDGADLAARFLTERGVAADRVEIVWDAIALHLHYDLALRKRPEIALVSAGAGYDLGPAGPFTLPEEYTARVHEALPRLHAAAVLHRAIVGQALAKPRKAPPFSLPGELVRQETGAVWPTWRELMSTPPSWNDYEGFEDEGREPGGGAA